MFFDVSVWVPNYSLPMAVSLVSIFTLFLLSLDEIPQLGQFIKKFLEFCVGYFVADAGDKGLGFLCIVTAKASCICIVVRKCWRSYSREDRAVMGKDLKRG